MAKQKSTFWADFKAFAMKGNIIDMAVGVVIGGAFGKIVSSLVNDIIMPLTGYIIGGFDFSKLSATLTNHVFPDKEPVILNYGMFIQQFVDFFIIALCIFLVLRAITKATSLTKKKQVEAEAQAPAPAPEKPADIALLEEIRDLLKENNK